MTLHWGHANVTLGRSAVLHDINLEARPGEFLALVGPNGAGKSTLLRSGLGLVPTTGSVTLEARPLKEWTSRDRALRLAYVPQRTHLDYPFTVRDAVAMARYARIGDLGTPTKDDARAVDDALHALELGPLAERTVTRLSGGERQRVALARGLAQGAGLLLLDEPTAGLDLGHAHRFLAFLRSIVGPQKGVVAALHDLEAASRVADRIALLDHGRIIAEGAPHNVLTPEHLSRSFEADVSVDWTGPGARISVG